MKIIENGDDSVRETNYLTRDLLYQIRDNTKSCRIEIGKEKNINPKGYTYQWPTMLSFMEKKWVK